jgi:hypothetical protein|uniref:Uncharacterized protein n=1 Tax=Siphoviridae sp. ctTPJ4 TaxID=2825519 RepID=A0A8S5V0P0_9CAUD|nr:MAG TPA: hypothetical protein [Siphoviridae sp. ctTPJ4]
MTFTLILEDGREVKRKIKEFGYEGDIADRDPNAAMVVTELDDNLTYLPLFMFVCEEWTDDEIVVRVDRA